MMATEQDSLSPASGGPSDPPRPRWDRDGVIRAGHDLAACAATARRLATKHDALVDELETITDDLATAVHPSRRRGELLDARWRIAGEADELRAAFMFSLRCLVRCAATARRAEACRREAR